MSQEVTISIASRHQPLSSESLNLESRFARPLEGKSIGRSHLWDIRIACAAAALPSLRRRRVVQESIHDVRPVSRLFTEVRTCPRLFSRFDLRQLRFYGVNHDNHVHGPPLRGRILERRAGDPIIDLLHRHANHLVSLRSKLVARDGLLLRPNRFRST